MFTKLGLCCLTLDKQISYKTITKKRFDSLDNVEKYNALENIYVCNIQMFISAIKFCSDNNIPMYRVTSHLFPFYESDAGKLLLQKFKNKLLDIGEIAKKLNIRVTMHPDQYVVLSSDSSQTIQNSINELIHHADIFDACGFVQNHYNLLNIHGGKKDRTNNLINTINNLPDNVKNRLTLENDENCYNSKQLYQVYLETGIPILFDFHHSLISNKCTNYNDEIIAEEFELAKSTWENKKLITTHISNGHEGLLNRKHSEYIEKYPKVMLEAPWIECEARGKENSIYKLKELMSV